MTAAPDNSAAATSRARRARTALHAVAIARRLTWLHSVAGNALNPLHPPRGAPCVRCRVWRFVFRPPIYEGLARRRSAPPAPRTNTLLNAVLKRRQQTPAALLAVCATTVCLPI